MIEAGLYISEGLLKSRITACHTMGVCMVSVGDIEVNDPNKQRNIKEVGHTAL